jgi:hypothetical protein
MPWARSNTHYCRCWGGCTLEPLADGVAGDVHEVALPGELGEVELLAGLERVDGGEPELLQVPQRRCAGLAQVPQLRARELLLAHAVVPVGFGVYADAKDIEASPCLRLTPLILPVSKKKILYPHTVTSNSSNLFYFLFYYSVLIDFDFFRSKDVIGPFKSNLFPATLHLHSSV